jgi:hypothetical protein
MVKYYPRKAEYNKEWRKSHADYHRQKAKEHYERNKQDIILKRALKRYKEGHKVGERLMTQLKEHKLIYLK